MLYNRKKTMKVKELIDKLKEFDCELEVITYPNCEEE